MRIIIDVCHPAHVHLFRNFARIMMSKGHKVLFTCRDKEHVTDLLATYGLDHIQYGRHYKKLSAKVLGFASNEKQLLRICRKFKADLMLSHNSTYAALASKLFGKPHIAFEDTFNMEQVRLSMPFTDVVLTGNYSHPELGKKELRYPGYHELAYLHPNNYNPDPNVLDVLDVAPDEPYAVVRFVAWSATHDVGHKGISTANKRALVSELSTRMKVFISSENTLEPEFSEFKLSTPPHRIHDVLNYARIFIGESATMASEAAILGTHSIFLHNTKFGSIDDQAAYGLLNQYSESEMDQTKAIDKALEISMDAESKKRLATGRQRMLEDKIDVTAFLCWLIENYPTSIYMARKQDFDFNLFR